VPKPTRPSPSWGQQRSSRNVRRCTTAKDVTVAAMVLAANAGGVAGRHCGVVVDSGIPDPARCGTLGGSRTNRIVEGNSPTGPRTPRSSLAERTTAAKNPQSLTLGAGPRAPREVESEWQATAVPALRVPSKSTIREERSAESDVDTVATAPGGVACQVRWPARYGSIGTVATVGPRGNTSRSSIDSGDAWADTTVRSL